MAPASRSCDRGARGGRRPADALRPAARTGRGVPGRARRDHARPDRTGPRVGRGLDRVGSAHDRRIARAARRPLGRVRRADGSVRRDGRGRVWRVGADIGRGAGVRSPGRGDVRGCDHRDRHRKHLRRDRAGERRRRACHVGDAPRGHHSAPARGAIRPRGPSGRMAEPGHGRDERRKGARRDDARFAPRGDGRGRRGWCRRRPRAFGRTRDGLARWCAGRDDRPLRPGRRRPRGRRGDAADPRHEPRAGDHARRRGSIRHRPAPTSRSTGSSCSRRGRAGSRSPSRPRWRGRRAALARSGSALASEQEWASAAGRRVTGRGVRRGGGTTAGSEPEGLSCWASPPRAGDCCAPTADPGCGGTATTVRARR